MRETARFGTAGAHLANEKAWVAALRSKKVPVQLRRAPLPRRARRSSGSSAGPSHFAGLEQIDQAYQGNKALLEAARHASWCARRPFVTDAQTILASYRADMSYRPMFIAARDPAFLDHDLHGPPRARGGVHHGHEGVRRRVWRPPNLGIPWVTYQSVAGGANPTYYLIVPMESYGTIDADLAGMRRGRRASFSSPAQLAEQFAGSTERVDTEVLTISPADQLRPGELRQPGQGVLER